MAKRVLVFAAHPDDDIIGCGGSLAKHVALGDQVSVCYMTSGDSGSLDISKGELARIREGEAKRAASVIGFHDLTFLKNPDGYLECDKRNLKNVVELIRTKKPNIIYVHHQSEGHQDHRTTCSLVLESIGRAGGPFFQEFRGKPWTVDTVLTYEVYPPLCKFNYVQDISKFINKKIVALRKHESQIRGVRYDEAAKALARYRGAMTGKGRYCEVFEIMKVSILP